MAQSTKIMSTKTTLHNLIKMLGKKDHIAIVSLDGTATKHHDVLTTHLQASDDDVMIVEKLQPGDYTHIEKGLRAGLVDLLDARNKQRKAASCIFLMTDGRVGTHTIHTFGFGRNSNERLLFDIARRSHVYHHVPDTHVKEDYLYDLLKADDLKKNAFAGALEVFRTICASRDLQVTLNGSSKVGGCKILEVHRHPSADCSKDPNGSADGTSCTIHFGSPESEPEDGEPLVVKIVKRSQTADENAPEEKQVNRELVRRTLANFLRKVEDLANAGKMEEARTEVLVARNVLSRLGNDDTDDAIIDPLCNELDILDKFLVSEDVYRNLGHPYLLWCITSHEKVLGQAKEHSS